MARQAGEDVNQGECSSIAGKCVSRHYGNQYCGSSGGLEIISLKIQLYHSWHCDRNTSHPFAHFVKCLIISGWHNLTVIRQGGIVGVGVFLLEEVCHWA